MRKQTKLPILLALLFLANVSFAQVKPNGSTQTPKTPTLPAVTYSGTDKVNYVRSYNFLSPMSTMPVDVLGGLTPFSDAISNGNIMQATQYVDGLGRPIQTVARQALPGDKDLVQFMVYDEYGRQVYRPMPFQSDAGDGAMHLSPSGRLNTFMNGNGQLTSGFYPYEDIFYGKVQYESSPLNRVLKQMAPGNSWAGSSVGVSNSWRTNNATDAVRRWVAGTGSASSPGVYSNNELMVTITEDEEQNQVREFTDKLGRTVLKRVQKSTGTADGRTNWLSTYYVYDDFGNLRFVLPPRAEEELSLANWTWNGIDMDALSFQYTYDGRNRMVTKQVPGAGRVDMVYDKLDRLVLTQDANQRVANQWTFTKYDNLNRPAMTGFVTSNSNRVTMQTQANAAAVLFVSTEPLNTSNVLEANSISISSHVSGTVTYRSKTTIEFLPGFDSNGQYFNTEIVPALSSEYTFVQGYHDATFPSLKNYAHEVISLNYYDDYGFTGTTYNSSLEVDFHPAGGSLNAINPAQYTNATGLATGSKVKVLGTADQWLTSVMFYDDRGRMVQAHGDNHMGGKDISTTQYDFSGKVLNTYTKHTNPLASGSDAQTLIAKRFTYDKAGRLLTVAQKLNGSGSHKTIVSNSYNALGELEEKTLGNSLETLEYDYNVRGWLKGINKDYVASGTGSHYFGMDLSYDWGFTDNQLNGNIAGVKWRSKSSDKQRAYGFGYDESNRLKKADYNQYDVSTWANTLGDFSTTYGYDANGNILNLTRKGVVAGTIATIDQLTYTYTNSGKSNRLQYVDDEVNDLGQGDFKDLNEGTDDYNYDANGNMNRDKNKGINTTGNITYNHLNLPKTVTFTGNRTITYTYDAAGIKLKKTTNDNGTVTTTDYSGGFIYENNALQHFAHEEGRVRKSGANLVYDYYIKDHLGNTRMTITEATDVTIYRATMETDVVPSTGVDLEEYEEDLFLNLPSSRDNGATSASVNTTNEPGISNDETARLNGADASRRIGPAKLLAVSPGDQINVSVNSYHTGFTGTQSPESQANIINALASAFGGSASSALGTESRSIYEFFNTNAALAYVGTNGSSSKPRAYLNVLIFDQDFKPVSGQSGFLQTDQASGYKTLNISKSIGQGGYVYVYLSNEGQTGFGFDVYFDDLSITHTKGAILQEDHYYPFGLSINALSSRAPLSKPNKYNTFQGQERTEDFDLGWYQFKWRNHDPTIGRFFNVDPLATEYTHNSPYAFSENRVINGVELEGLEWGGMTYGYNAAGARANVQATAMKSTRNPTEKKQDLAMQLDAIPVIGDVKGFVEAFTGSDLVSGERLSGFSRAAGLLFLSELRPAGTLSDMTRMSDNLLGSGKWIDAGESMSDAAASFQKQITGVDAAKSFELNGVKFDGLADGGVLLDAKSGMGNFVNKDGGFHSWWKGSDGLLNQANRQLKAADGAKIQWHFENKNVMQATQNLFKEQGIEGIELIHTPRN
ncbi:DUF6443 domain-containing protein [Roseivirga seohaensis]|uniref:DUF6443 domain-containing protein n=1 Tax=Roseivirga seohaensis TaxID=1914963 RepID=UPI003BAD7F42